MKNRLLTIDDLYNFYSTKKKSMTFSADKSGYNIAVQVNGKFEVEDDENSEGLLYGRVKAFHDLGNRNKSYIDTEVFEKHVASMKDRPIMADIIDVEDKDGNIIKDFNGHTMKFDEENDKIIYIEKPVGHFVNPENFELVYDEEFDRTFVFADCVIYEEYTDACDILRRRQETDVSVELCIRDLAYDCKTHELHINNFYVQGCTLLGEHVQPGMAGSKLSLKDFSEENNSVFSNLSERDEMKEKLIEMQESINTLLSRFNIDDSKESKETYGKEEIEVENQDILVNEEVTETEETVVETEEVTEIVTNEESTEETDEVTVVESTEEVTETEAEESENPVEDETPEVVEVNSEDDDKDDQDDDQDKDDDDDDDDDKEKFELVEKTFEFDGKKFSVSFELSHEDIRCGLYGLITQYEELDNEWYSIRAVYDDCFAFQGWFTNKIYGQKYVKEGDTVALDGERYTLHEELLTDSELAQLNDMRANYSSIQTELNTYKTAEAYADKMTIFEEESYAQFLETPEFKELMSDEIVNKYSKEELEDKANIAFSKLVKKNKTFALDTSIEEKPVAKPMFAFGKIEQKSSFLDGLLNQKKTN